MVADDLNQLQLPVPQGVIAIRTGRKADFCTDLCQRLLLNGAASQVLLERIEAADVTPDLQTEVTAFRMEKRDICPRAKIENVETDLDLASDVQADKIAALAPTAATPMLLQIASGNCLVQEKVLLGTADTVITSVRLSYKNATNRQGFAIFFGNLILADRM